MINAESFIQNLLSNLRKGVYDDENTYAIDCWKYSPKFKRYSDKIEATIIIEQINDPKVAISVYVTNFETKYFLGFNYYKKFKNPVVSVKVRQSTKSSYSDICDDTPISNSLFDSFVSFVTERGEQDSLIAEFNAESVFGNQ